MQFRPCIDIHDGKVKQIVGSTLRDASGKQTDNFVSTLDAADYAALYAKYGLSGGHVILLNKEGTEEYKLTKEAALRALAAYPGGLQIGGGINPDNAQSFLDAGASHVIVTSYVFSDGKVDYEHLRKLYDAVGKQHLVLDLSCKFCEADEEREAGYYIVTDRWQKVTKERICVPVLEELSTYCSEFLIHAVDVEGKNNGIEQPLVAMLADWNKIVITYAGGIHSLSDIEIIRTAGDNKMNFTIGSALDLFGGSLSFDEIRQLCEQGE